MLGFVKTVLIALLFQNDVLLCDSFYFQFEIIKRDVGDAHDLTNLSDQKNFISLELNGLL